MLLLICTIPLICAAITDWRKRIIPDWTWIVIFIMGIVTAVINEYTDEVIFNVSLTDKIAGFLIPTVTLFVIALKFGGNGIGGGDIKLTAAMGFCFGLYGLVFILFFAVIPACVYAGVKKQRNIPLGTFLCIGFLAYVSLVFFLRKIL